MHGWAKSRELLAFCAFWCAAGKAGCFRAFQFGKQSQQSRVGGKQKAESRKSLLSKSGWTLAAPISGGVRERPSKFPSQPKHTNQTHAPKYRLSESEFTYKSVINIIYINIAVKSLKI